MRLSLNLEEKIPVIIHIQDFKNVIADILSSLDKVDTYNPIYSIILSLFEYFSLEKEDVTHPVDYTILYNTKKE